MPWDATVRVSIRSFVTVSRNRETWLARLSHGMAWDATGCHEMPWDASESHEMLWDDMGCHGMP